MRRFLDDILVGIQNKADKYINALKLIFPAMYCHLSVSLSIHVIDHKMIKMITQIM